MFEYVINLPEIARELLYTDLEFLWKNFYKFITNLAEPLTLTPGKREALSRYIDAHPEEIKYLLELPEGLPPSMFYIEDYLYEIPYEFEDSMYPRVAINPCLLMEYDELDNLISDWDLSMDIEDLIGSSPDVNPLADHERSELNRSYHYDNDNEADIAYIAAVMGIKFAPTLNRRTLNAIADIIDVGGLGFEFQDANPLSIIFIESFRFLDSNEIENICQCLKIYIRDYTFAYFKLILQRGYIYPLPSESDQTNSYDLIEKRSLAWHHMSDKQKSIFTHYNEEPQIYIYDANSDLEFESLVEQWNDDIETCKVIIKRYELLIPPGCEICSYVGETLRDMYHYCICGHSLVQEIRFDASEWSSNFKHIKTDIEYYDTMGIYTGHTKWSDIIFLYANFTSEHWMRFFVSRDIFSKGQMLICYGSQQNYVTHTLDELIERYTVDRNPERTYEDIIGLDFQLDARGDIQKLQTLITCLLIDPPHMSWIILNPNDIIQLHTLQDTIALTQAYIKELSNLTYHIKLRYTKLNQADKGVILMCLNDIFYMGMKFRRWRGPGYEFPYTRNETLIDDYDLDMECDDIRIKFITDYMSMSELARTFLDTLKIPFFSYDDIKDFYDVTFLTDFIDYWLGIINGHLCVRSTSKYYINMGYYYSYIFGNITITYGNVTYNPNKLQDI